MTEFDIPGIEAQFGYVFRDRGLLEAALTHSSALPPGVVRTSEQLEFLGDAVLGVIIADRLLGKFPDFDEGKLSKCRALLVCSSTLATKAREFNLGEALFLGRGEERSGGREKDSILSATYEAVIGAVFRDGGFVRTRELVERHFQAEVESGWALVGRDWKTILQERTQAGSKTVPEYRIVEEHGPAHAPRFKAEVWVGEQYLGCGEGPSKRSAEQNAAQAALAVPDEV